MVKPNETFEDLESWLANSSGSVLEDVSCEEIPPGFVGHGIATAALRNREIYRRARQAFPNGPWTKGAVTAWIGEQDEVSSWRWLGDDTLDEVVAAAVLGRQGDLDAVLLDGDLASHNYDFFSGGEGTARPDAYTRLLPSVASYTSARSEIALAGVDRGPGWWDWQDHYNTPTAPVTLARALGEDLTTERRRALVGVHGAESAGAGEFIAVARALEMDTSFLAADIVAAGEAWVDAVLGEISRPDIDGEALDRLDMHLEGIHTICTVAANIDRLLADTRGLAYDDTQALDRVRQEHRWIYDWEANNIRWRYASSWPAGPFRDAIAQSLSDQFV
jgi:hypothetical protein